MIEYEPNTDNLPIPNIPLLRKAVEWVEAEANKDAKEREWLQGDWLRKRSAAEQEQGWCGTACCVAGWVGIHAEDAQPKMAVRDFRTGELEYTGMMEYPDGLMVHVEEYAQHALGLTAGQADRLFSGSNTAETIRQIAEEIAGEAL